MVPSARAVRERLGHPVVDSDAHLVEYLPLVRDFVVEEAGEQLAQRFDAVLSVPAHIGRLPSAARRALGMMRPPWWALTSSSLDRATAMLPALLHDRLDDLGFDFAFLYPTHGMLALHAPDAELRTVAARAFNRHAVETCRGVRDRVEPVAAIPAQTPREALDAIVHAVDELGLKSVVLTGIMPRPPVKPHGIVAFDGLGHGAARDYDLVWRACAARGLTPTFHTPGFGFGTRASTDNYVFNHVGGFAAGAEGTARSLLFGGVPMRFPELRFVFLEGGVTWAVALRAELCAHFAKRAGAHIARLDPAHLDPGLVRTLVSRYGVEALRARLDRLDDALKPLADVVGDTTDEFAASGFRDVDDILAVFERQVFAGCEADDPLTFLALDPRVQSGRRVGALLGSDLGHWDTADATQVLPEAWEHVERGLLTEEQLQALTLDDPIRAWAGDGLGPFRGTVLEAQVACRTGAPQPIQADGSNVSARSPESIQENR